MNLIYHRSVQSDVSAVLGYYDEVGGPGLGEAFLDEFMTHVAWALENPTRFHPVEGDLRRVNLQRFPYHFLYRVHGDTLRILVLRHHHRDPAYGLKRR
jgi:plasmid stabilization system protein ParE